MVKSMFSEKDDAFIRVQWLYRPTELQEVIAGLNVWVSARDRLGAHIVALACQSPPGGAASGQRS